MSIRFRLMMALWLGAGLPLSSGSLQAADERAFYGDDLAVVGEPYALQLPAGADCEVSWGDGVVEKVANAPATHIFKKPGVAAITVKVRQGSSRWAPVPVDFAARVVASRPVFFVKSEVNAGTVLPKVLAAPVDSFSVECRVQMDNPATDQVIFAAQESAPGACRFGIKNQSLFFELIGASEFTAPLGKRLAAGQWHHLAVTYDRAPLFPRSNQVRFFVDGLPARAGMIPADDAGAVRCSTAVAGANGFKGKIEALAVYDNLLFPLAIWEHASALSGDTSLGVTVAYKGSAVVTVNPPVIARTVDVPLDPNPQADNGPALRKALGAAAAGTRLRLVSAADAGRGGTFYVRSLIEAPKWAGLLIENKTDFELDGNGSTLVFSDKMARYVLIDKCQRLAVRNLSFDLDPSYARVGVYAKLLEVDPATATVKAQLVKGRDGSPDPVIPRRASYWRWRPHDPKTLRIGSGPHFSSGSYAEKPRADPASGPGVIRFKLKENAKNKLWNDLKAYAAGANFFLINNGDFASNAVSLMHSSHVTFDRVNYYATLGMVFLSSDIDHLHITRCKIGLPPGQSAADRPLSAGADGYHFHLTQGDILFEGNEITLTDDDPISIKDSIWPNVEKVGDNQLKAGKGIAKGHPVELLDPDYSCTGFTAKVTEVNGDVLTLDKPLPNAVKKGSLLMNRSHHTMNWMLRDNYLHDYYGRVMLYTDFGTVTNNRVHRSYYHLGNSTAYFEHAGASRNVITHRNLFESTNADSSNWGGNQSIPSFHEITYSANSFLGKGLHLNNAMDSLVARNWFHGEDAVLSINRCADTQVRNNLGFQPGAPEFKVQAKDNTNVVIEGNANKENKG